MGDNQNTQTIIDILNLMLAELKKIRQAVQAKR